MVSMRWTLISVIIVSAMGGSLGCDPGRIYTSNGGNSPAAEITDRVEWTATGTVALAEHAIDGVITTAAVSRESNGGGSITIDLGRPCQFNLVILDHGRQEWAFARETVLLTSVDGKNYRRQWTAPGNRRVTSLCMFSPVLARYIRIQAFVPGDEPWTVAEIYVQ